MSGLAGDAVDPAALLLFADDCMAEPLCDHPRESATYAMRLPAGCLLQLKDCHAFSAAEQCQHRVLSGAARASWNMEFNETRFDAALLILAKVYAVAADQGDSAVAEPQGERPPVVITAPNDGGVRCGHLLQQSSLEQAFSNVADSTALHCRRDRIDAAVGDA